MYSIIGVSLMQCGHHSQIFRGVSPSAVCNGAFCQNGALPFLNERRI